MAVIGNIPYFQTNPYIIMQFVDPSKGIRQDCANAMGQLDDRQRCTAVVDLTKGTLPGLMKGMAWSEIPTLGIPGVLPSIESWNPQTLNLAWGDELIMLGWTGWKSLESNFLLCSFTNISPVLLPMFTRTFPIEHHKNTRIYQNMGGHGTFWNHCCQWQWGDCAVQLLVSSFWCWLDFWTFLDQGRGLNATIHRSIHGDFPLPYLITLW
jgi:hypothetical protein